ncbi:cation/H(+) antiporter [Aeromicrobium sp. A1-2]|uniref:cation:proton antiporter n=1 Tax=Aeromicrobium sp. A1-2 TaxID=2107713 RepID=UPI000E4FA297|nr:cation:proton antiporter [Aeromicrobium sp. A1-2]AXT85010.1 cation/H(+) antiporter [Aeromicrobium sp. A1-2]
MEVSTGLLLELGLLLLVLTVLGSGARRLGLSPIPLYLLAGLFLGRGGIATVPEANDFIEAGATIGLVLLLLVLGLEFTIDEFTTSLRRHLGSAVVDLVLNATPGALAGWLLGLDTVGIVALAGATYISSSGIIARVLGDLQRLGNRETPAVLSVLVLEDFVMAAYLPVLAVLASGGTWWQALIGAAVAVGALSGALVASQRYGHRVGQLVSHPDPEQLLLRVLGLTLVVAAFAEFVHASAAVGAFLVGLTLTGAVADRARAVLSPLRDLFAAVFFLAIGLAVDPSDLLPALPAAALLAVVTVVSKIATGWYAAGREGAGRPGRWRAGTALTARGEFSLVIIGLVGTQHESLGDLVTAYVIVLAVLGPLLARMPPPRLLLRPRTTPRDSAP